MCGLLWAFPVAAAASRSSAPAETDISNASRPIKQEEIDLCAENGIEFIELPVAFDGISVITNPENDWAMCLTTDELRTMWEAAAQGTITSWNQIRADFPR